MYWQYMFHLPSTRTEAHDSSGSDSARVSPLEEVHTTWPMTALMSRNILTRNGLYICQFCGRLVEPVCACCCPCGCQASCQSLQPTGDLWWYRTGKDAPP